jgi:S-adenosylmethionine:tRNA ribosyltransferase-isomerase
MAAAGLIADLTLPADLEAGEPPEARGLKRDDVRLLVTHVGFDLRIEHARFSDLPGLLSPGDVLVVNTSRTLSAALMATRADGERCELHLSTRLPGGFWAVELRRADRAGSLPYPDARAGTTLQLAAGGRATLLAPYPVTHALESPSRLWIAALQLPEPTIAYLGRHGFPIRYRYVKDPWPIEMYQTIFAEEAGSAEMPSAGRPFTPELVTRLVSRGVQIAPLVLHTGVASLEDHEPPYEEIYRVPGETAERVNAARSAGHRIIAVGTTVVRALETATDARGITSAAEGWTSLVINRQQRLRAVHGLITGLHEPRSTHLAILEAVVAAAARRASRDVDQMCPASVLTHAYAAAVDMGYLWHEFGDSHLIVAARW